MPRHVHQDVATVVREQPLAARHLLPDAVRQQADEVLHRHLVPPVVHLDVVSVEIDGAVGVGVDGAGEGIARVAGHVVGEHEDDLRVGDAEPLDGAVHGQHVGQMPVVEPEARCADQHSPVACVLCRHERRRRQHCSRDQRWETEDARELHFGCREEVRGPQGDRQSAQLNIYAVTCCCQHPSVPWSWSTESGKLVLAMRDGLSWVHQIEGSRRRAEVRVLPKRPLALWSRPGYPAIGAAGHGPV